MEGQSTDFCHAVNTIMSDGCNKFRNVKGNLLNANENATTWACGIKVPGTINSRFVASMGLFYEGALLQTSNKEALNSVYDTYKVLLDTCLLSQGYTCSVNENYYPGLSDFKKLVYIYEQPDSSRLLKPQSHVTLEVASNKNMGIYTIVMYIFDR